MAFPTRTALWLDEMRRCRRLVGRVLPQVGSGLLDVVRVLPGVGQGLGPAKLGEALGESCGTLVEMCVMVSTGTCGGTKAMEARSSPSVIDVVLMQSFLSDLVLAPLAVQVERSAENDGQKADE